IARRRAAADQTVDARRPYRALRTQRGAAVCEQRIGRRRRGAYIVTRTSMSIRSILWPTDFSDDSRHALEHAVAIARWYSARIVALHACSPAMVDAPVLVGAGPSAPSSHATYAEELQLLEEIESRRGAGIEIAVDVVKGSAA